MNFVTIDARKELEAFLALAKIAGGLVKRDSLHVLNRANHELHATLNKNRTEEFSLGIRDPLVIETDQYRGTANQPDRLRYVRVNFELQLRPFGEEGRYCVIGGGSKVEICNADNETLRKCHYDICSGGWAPGSELSWHPFFHFQIKGNAEGEGESALPRLPCLIGLPSDVLDFSLLEFHPKKWPEVNAKPASRRSLAKHRAGQRSRLQKVSERFIASTNADLPLRGLQLPLAVALPL